MTNSKSPYELRLDMLKMAKDYLDQQFSIAYSAWEKSVEASVQFAKQVKEEVPQIPELPKMYGIEEISKMAETLNKFVSGNK